MERVEQGYVPVTAGRAARSGARAGARAGGRAARMALRQAPLAEDLRPIRPGLRGGQYRPLSDACVARIHETALPALSEIGLANAPPSGIEILTGAGAELGEDGRIRFPRMLVEEMQAVAARGTTLHGRDAAHDLQLGDARVHYGTAVAAVHVVDLETRSYSESTAADLYTAAKLAQHLDNVHFFQRPMVCRDIADPYEMDVNTLYACLSGTTKHVGTSFSDPVNVAGRLDLIHLVRGRARQPGARGPSSAIPIVSSCRR